MLHLLLAAALISPTPDPYDIFARARAYWQTQRYPTAISYDVAISVREGGIERTQRYGTYYDAVANVITVDPVSDYELAHPTYPTGIGIGLLFWRLNKPLPPADWLGVPKIAPTYSFGMAPFVPAPTPTPFNSSALVDEIRSEFHDANPHASPTPTPDMLSEIATVVARNRDYDITLLGTDTVDGHECYHLGLQPSRDPKKFRIRQAWVDQSTFATWKLVDALNFKSGPGTNMPWTIHFVDIAGAHYISEEDASAPMGYGGLIFSSVSYRFENVGAATKSPLTNLMMNGTLIEEP